MDMNDNEIIEDFTSTRNLSHRTKMGYIDTIRIYTTFTGKTLEQLLTEAETEEDQGIRWKRRTLKKRLTQFRTHLQEQYLTSTARIHLSRIQTIYKHYEIELHDLPPTSTKNIKESTPLNFQDLPDKEIIKKALKITNPLMRALILFMTSSGCARRETLNLTIQDFIEATKTYHDKNNIYEVIEILKDRDDVIPTFKLKRQKTGKHYFTFCSPESTSEIINYLLTINKPLKNQDKLFRIGLFYFNKEFAKINDTLALGKKGTYNRFRSHMLRKFHASQLYNAGMSLEEVDSLQGRSKDMTHASYFMEDPEKLRQRYIKHINSVTINLDVNNLDLKSPEYIQLENKYEQEKKTNEENSQRIDKLEAIFKNFNDDLLKKL